MHCGALINRKNCGSCDTGEKGVTLDSQEHCGSYDTTEHCGQSKSSQELDVSNTASNCDMPSSEKNYTSTRHTGIAPETLCPFFTSVSEQLKHLACCNCRNSAGLERALKSDNTEQCRAHTQCSCMPGLTRVSVLKMDWETVEEEDLIAMAEHVDVLLATGENSLQCAILSMIRFLAGVSSVHMISC